MKRLILGLLMLAVVPVWAADDGDETGDAPERGVARLSVVQGNVSMRRGDSGEIIAGALNAPIVIEDRLITGEGARAEVQFDWANMIRLAPGTEVRFSQLQDRQYQIQVAVGMVTFRVLRDSNALVEISTPNVSIRPLKQGAYRVLVRPDGTSQVIVLLGEGEIFSPKGTERLQAGQSMEARGNPSDPEFQVGPAPQQDEWDRWNADRDRDLERTGSYKYVSPDVTGAEELDAHGTWENDPQYGNVWIPRVDADWAPYSVGRWSWIDYYGWTWVSGDPFGWAPYHYGRWYHGSRGWAWWPGGIGSRHYWRPALVGFFGWGGGGGFGFGFGNVGWVPLAPYERYHPWYGRNYYGNYRRGSFNQANIIRNTNIFNTYRNARVRNGVSGVAAGSFGRGGINTRNFVRPTSGDLSRAGAVRGQVGLAPTRDSNRFSDRNATTAGMPRTSYSGSFVSRSGATGGQQRLGGSNLRFGGQNAGGVNGVSGVSGPVNRGGAINNGGSGSGNWQRFNPGQGGQNRGGQNPAFQGGQRGFGGSNTAPSSGGVNRGIDSGAPQQRGGSQGGWQRFDPNQQRVQSPQRGRSFDGGSVNRPSSPPMRNDSPNRTYSPQPQMRNDSRGRSYSPPSYSAPPMRNDPPARTYAPPMRNDSPGGSMGRPSNRDGGQQPVRISPPMVRSYPGGGGGNYNRPAPSQAPRAAPAAPRSAPQQRSAPAPRNDRGGNQGNGGGQGRRNR